MATYTVMSGDGTETLGSFSSMAEAESFLSGEGYSTFTVDDRREGGGRTSGVSIGGGEDALRSIRSGGASGGIKSVRTNYSGMPFSKAFSSARSTLGPGQTFEWNGKQYSTATAEERPDLAAPKPQVLDPAPSVVQPEILSKFSVPPELPGGYLGELAGMDAPITNRVAPAAPSVPGAYSPPPADTSTASTPTTTPSGPSIAYGLSDDEIRNRLSTSNYSPPSIDELVGRESPLNELNVVAPAPSASQALGQITAAAGQELSDYLAGVAGAQSAVPRAEPFTPSDSEYLSAAYGPEGFPSYGSPEPSPAPYEVATSLADASRAMEVPSTTGGLGDYKTYREAYEGVKGLSDYMARAREEFADHDLVKQQEMGQYMFNQAAPYNTSRREDAARGEYAASMAAVPQQPREFGLRDVINRGASSFLEPMTELGFDNLPPLSDDESPLIGRNSPPLRSSSPIAPRPDYRVDYPVFSADFSSASSPYITGLGTLRGAAGRVSRGMRESVAAQREQSQRETPTISTQGLGAFAVDQYADYASDSMDAAREAMPEILGSRLAPRRSRIRPQRPRWGM